MSLKHDRSAPARPSEKYYVVEIDGEKVKIAYDEYQPGGKNRSPKAFSVVGSVFRAAREMRERDAKLD
jgi:predicted DNA-binding WGR domain protein